VLSKSRLLAVFFISFLFITSFQLQAGLETSTVIECIAKEKLADHPYGYQDALRDYYPTDAWRNCTPEEQGMNSTRLNEMVPYIESNEWPIDSVIIVRGGYIVYEQYPSPDFGVEDIHTLQSVTKSFTSALVGLAIKEGFLASVNETIVDLFSHRDIQNLDERKERMTVEHLLTMTAGVEWDEWTYPYTDTVHNSLAAMVMCDDAIEYFLNLPMVAEPGEEWVYNSGACMVLGVLIENLTNMTLLDFAQEYLFDPVGISDALFLRTYNGIYQAGGGLYLKPRDMARFGYLYLNGGLWNGTQIIPQDWVLDSSEYHYLLPPYEAYGYYWWMHPAMDVYQALRRFGQRIMISPAEDLVVIFTASIMELYHPHQELYFDYVLQSIIGPPREVTQTTTTTGTVNTYTGLPPGEYSNDPPFLGGIFIATAIVGVVGMVFVILLKKAKTSQ
jgi:CubicO group peptidase (beta-lactamase class C family)